MPLIRQPARGFTLTELAVVLIIVALLTGGLMTTLSAQRAMQQRNTSERQLNEIRDAMIGFAAANGRLPCPATDTSNGLESFCATEGETQADCDSHPTTVAASHGHCQRFINGYVPGATLGFSPLDDKGRVLDGWNNPIRYSVTKEVVGGVQYAFTKTDGLKQAGLDQFGAVPNLLSVCRAYPGSLTASACDSTANTLTKLSPVVLLSTGQSGDSSTNNDVLTNRNDKIVFVSHTPTPATGTDTGFDDIVLWLSPNILYHRMIQAGRLP